MYVYKITNLINNKVYIGITNNYKKRWSNEVSNIKNNKKQQLITKKIQQYGKENFSFEILYRNLSVEEAVLKEEELIKKYNSCIKNENSQGYNIDRGGKYHPTRPPQYGGNNGNACLTNEEAQYIKDHRDQPAILLYEEFADKIGYDAFKKCYNDITYPNIKSTTIPYPYNAEFSNQFTSSYLEYDEVLELRERYEKGEFWKDVYKEYKDLYSEMSFWNVYNGNSYPYVRPEVFTLKNKKIHASLAKSGERNGRSKITRKDVEKIRYLYEKENKTRQELYALYPQLSTTSIRDIINYKTWKN